MPNNDYLRKLDLLKLMGVDKSPPEVQERVLQKAEVKIMEFFFDRILPNYISSEEINHLKELAGKNIGEFDAEMEKLFSKNPDLPNQIESAGVNYKKGVIKNRIEKFKSENKLSESEYIEAKNAIEAENWEKAADIILSKIHIQ